MGFFGALSISCQFVGLHSTHSIYSHMFTAPACSCSPHTHPFVFCASFLSSFTSSPFGPSYLLFPFSYSLLTTIITSRPPSLPLSPHVVLHSSPPSFKCWWAAEQYPGGHGDRQPPPCGLFLLLSLDLLLLGSYTLLTAHILA